MSYGRASFGILETKNDTDCIYKLRLTTEKKMYANNISQQ